MVGHPPRRYGWPTSAWHPGAGSADRSHGYRRVLRGTVAASGVPGPTRLRAQPAVPATKHRDHYGDTTFPRWHGRGVSPLMPSDDELEWSQELDAIDQALQVINPQIGVVSQNLNSLLRSPAGQWDDGQLTPDELRAIDHKLQTNASNLATL